MGPRGGNTVSMRPHFQIAKGEIRSKVECVLSSLYFKYLFGITRDILLRDIVELSAGVKRDQVQRKATTNRGVNTGDIWELIIGR